MTLSHALLYYLNNKNFGSEGEKHSGNFFNYPIKNFRVGVKKKGGGVGWVTVSAQFFFLA
jgi:hypothetical protein